jgi:hypothetical protein
VNRQFEWDRLFVDNFLCCNQAALSNYLDWIIVMDRYLQTVAVAIFVLSTTAFVQAQTANPVEQTTIAIVDLTSEQQNAIYAAVTEGIRERDPPEIRVGDELPWWVQPRTLPGSLQIGPARGFIYAVLLIRFTSEDLLKAANLAVFELGMWRSWTGR